MSKKEQFIKDLVTWGLENEKNKVEAMDAVCEIINTLNHPSSFKKLTPKRLEDISSGSEPIPCHGATTD